MLGHESLFATRRESSSRAGAQRLFPEKHSAPTCRNNHTVFAIMCTEHGYASSRLFGVSHLLRAFSSRSRMLVERRAPTLDTGHNRSPCCYGGNAYILEWSRLGSCSNASRSSPPWRASWCKHRASEAYARRVTRLCNSMQHAGLVHLVYALGHPRVVCERANGRRSLRAHQMRAAG